MRILQARGLGIESTPITNTYIKVEIGQAGDIYSYVQVLQSIAGTQVL